MIPSSQRKERSASSGDREVPTSGHGISRLSAGGENRISAGHDEHSLHLRVRDNGPGLGKGDGSPCKMGLGLKATRDRLETLFGNEQTFEVREPGEGRVEVWV